MAKRCERCGYPPESWLRLRKMASGRSLALCEMCIEDQASDPQLGDRMPRRVEPSEFVASLVDEQERAREVK